MFQRVTIIGRVGQDPQMRYTPDGTPVTNLSVATTEFISKKKFDGSERPCPNGWKESYNGKGWEVTTWWRVAVWRGQAETVNTYVTKGMLVYVEGKVSGEAENASLNPRVWTGNDGEARASFEMTANTVKFMSQGNGSTTNQEPPPEGIETDALPF